MSTKGGQDDFAEAACIVCFEPFSKDNLRTSICCHHKGVCSICFLRIRALQRNMGCPECKANLDHIICLPCDSKKEWSDFTIWGDSCGPDYTLDPRSQIFFPKQYFRSKVESLWACKCSLCGQSKRDMKALKAHYTSDHSLHLCALCIEFKQAFPSEQKVYSQHEYETHLRKGDKDGSEGHPNCEFCRKRYYDKSALFMHMSRDHYTCHLCEKQGIQFKYYQEYANVEAHYRKEHFICEDPACLQKQFIAFSNEFDLATHTVQWHPLAASSSRKLPIRFKVRGSNNASRVGASSSSLRSGGGDADQGNYSDEDDEEERNAKPAGRSTFGGTGENGASSRFDGGTGGTARGGEWQIELPPGARDPRDSNRAGVVSAGGDLLAPSLSMALASATAEEFPSLLSAGGGSGMTLWWGLGPNNASKKNRANSDFPALPGTTEGKVTKESWEPPAPASTQPASMPLGVAVGSWARVKTDKRFAKGKKGGISLPYQDDNQSWEAIDASRSLAVRIHMGQIDPYAQRSSESGSTTTKASASTSAPASAPTSAKVPSKIAALSESAALKAAEARAAEARAEEARALEHAIAASKAEADAAAAAAAAAAEKMKAAATAAAAIAERNKAEAAAAVKSKEAEAAKAAAKAAAQAAAAALKSKKAAPPVAPPAIAGWSTAFESVGLTTSSKSQKAPKGLTVIKANSKSSSDSPRAVANSSFDDLTSLRNINKSTSKPLVQQAASAVQMSNPMPPPPGLSAPPGLSFSEKKSPNLQESASYSIGNSGSSGSLNSLGNGGGKAGAVVPAASPIGLGPPPGLSSVGWTKIGGTSGSRTGLKESSTIPPSDFPSLPPKAPSATSDAPPKAPEPWKPVVAPSTAPKQSQNKIPKKLKADLLQLAMGIKR